MYESDHPLETWSAKGFSAGTGRAPSASGKMDNSLALLKAALDHPESAGIGPAERG